MSKKHNAPIVYNPKPICKDCGHSDNVVKWMGQWICKIHLIVDVQPSKTPLIEQTLQLPRHVQEELKRERSMTFEDLFPNRAARRAAKKARHERA